MHSNIWSAVSDAVLNNDIAGIASDFGKIPEKSEGLAVSILVDIALTAWGLVMGPSWNKRKCSHSRDSIRGPNNEVIQ